MNPKRLAFLDPIRGAAIIVVFLFHAVWMGWGRGALPFKGLWPDFQDVPGLSYFAVYPLASVGAAGVAVFFAVSGCCIHLSFRNNPSWVEFAARRFWRIYPPYLCALLVFGLTFPLTRTADAGQWFTHLLLVHNVGVEYLYGVNAAFWSIAVEVQLYLIYPLLILATRRLGWRNALIAIGILELSLRSMSMCHAISLPYFLTHSPFYYWFSWSVGAYTAECFTNGHRSFERWNFPAVLTTAILATQVSVSSVYYFPLFALATAVLIGKLVLIDYRPGPIGKYLSEIGLWSYSIYLFHHPLLMAIGKLMPHDKSNLFGHAPFRMLAAVIGWFAIVWISRLSYRLIELPSNGIGKAFSSQSRGLVGSAS